MKVNFQGARTVAQTASISSCDMRKKRYGLRLVLTSSEAVTKLMRSNAVSRVCRRDDTNTSVGFSGEYRSMAAKVGLFMVAIRGQ